MVFVGVGVVGAVGRFLAPIAKRSLVVLHVPTAFDSDILSTPGAHDAPAWSVIVSGVTTTKAAAVELPPWSPALVCLADGMQVFELAA